MRHTGQEFKHFMDDSGLSFSQVSTLMRLHITGRADISDIARQIDSFFPDGADLTFELSGSPAGDGRFQRVDPRTDLTTTCRRSPKHDRWRVFATVTNISRCISMFSPGPDVLR